MFSGIVEGKGELVLVKSRRDKSKKLAGLRIKVNWGCLSNSDVQIGDSVSVNGICLTVVTNNFESFEADVSNETLLRTVGLEKLGVVNLEKAIKYSDRIGGHLVTGHVDGVAEIVLIESIDNSRKLDVLIPQTFGKFISKKGSIALNGVSLTVNSVEDFHNGCLVSVNLIPHTWETTSFAQLKTNSKVNFEVDLIARNLYRLLQDRELLEENSKNKKNDTR
ncbi:MAG: riboflavin synthase [Burkholderiaceae bacterium]|tara:strand:+ start:4670 stop:5332 length:663 start_codon:yes stop_codon:yes gene_type:complete